MTAVWVLGNASVDLGFEVPRLPAPGETLMATGLARAPGGKGLNQAVVAARAGVAVHFAAPLGRDAEAALVRAALARENFASLLLIETDAPTDMSILLVGQDSENCIVSTGASADSLGIDDAVGFAAGIAAGDVLLMQGNLTRQATLAAARVVIEAGASVVLNTAPLRWELRPVLPLCAVVVANEGEATEATGRGAPGAAAAWMLAEGAGAAIVTLGARGCLVATPEGVTRHQAREVTAVDTTGAGDAFCGALAACLARGIGLSDAVDIGQAAAALAVGRSGCFAALPSSAEIAGLLGAVARPG